MLQKPPPMLKRAFDESTLDDDVFIMRKARKTTTQTASTPTVSTTPIHTSCIPAAPTITSTVISRATSSQPPTSKHESPLDDDVFIFKRARKSSAQTSSTPPAPATTVPSSSATAPYAAAAPSTSLATSFQSAGLQHFLDHLHGATPEKLSKFLKTTARFRHELSLRSPSSVATMPARPHTVKLRLDTKKEANPYVPSKLSGVEHSGKEVVTAVVDPVLGEFYLSGGSSFISNALF
ncbi:hypothetical protein HDU80_002477, partial [Chytriomyces hyalinus]